MKTPYLKKITWACALCFGSFSGRLAQAEGFVRAGAQYVGYTASGFSSEAGGSLAAGATWGAAQEHEVSLEAMRAAWSLRDTLGQNMVPGGGGSGHITPLLAGYRYYFGTAATRLRFYAGGSVGMTKTAGEVTVALSGIQSRSTPDETGLAWAATVGVTGKLAGRLAYDVGYRYLHTEGFDAPSRLYVGASGYTGGPGPVMRFPALEAHCVALALRVSF